jgi:hypothetical protein
MRFSEITESAGLDKQLYAPHPNRTISEANQLKPQVKIWTSTAIKESDGFTSQWVQWCESENPQWIGHTGLLFDVQPSARILTITSDKDAIQIAKHYGVKFKNKLELMSSMPWDAIGRDYDAVHYTRNSGQDLIMGTWDVESTAWYNPNLLINKQKVKLARE